MARANVLIPTNMTPDNRAVARRGCDVRQDNKGEFPMLSFEFGKAKAQVQGQEAVLALKQTIMSVLAAAVILALIFFAARALGLV
jgi:hypothetical protein